MSEAIGFKTLYQLIVLARQHLGEKSESFWDDEDIVRHINDEQTFLMSRILQADGSYFDVTGTITLASGTAEYDIPADCVEIRHVEYASGSVEGDRTITPVRYQDRLLYDSLANDGGTGARQNRSRFWMRRDKIGFAPTPGQAATVNLMYCRRLMPLHYAAATAGAASTITFPSSATYGEVSNITDFYKNERIYIVSGTGAGQIRTISSYVGSTRVATVGTAWTTTPDSTSVYSLISEIPPENHDLLALGAAIRCTTTASQKETPTNLTERYTELYNQMVFEVEDRQSQEPRFVSYARYADDDDLY